MKKLIYRWSNGKVEDIVSTLAQAKELVATRGGSYQVEYMDIKPAFVGVPSTENPKSKFYKGWK